MTVALAAIIKAVLVAALAVLLAALAQMVQVVVAVEAEVILLLAVTEELARNGRHMVPVVVAVEQVPPPQQIQMVLSMEAVEAELQAELEAMAPMGSSLFRGGALPKSKLIQDFDRGCADSVQIVPRAEHPGLGLDPFVHQPHPKLRNHLVFRTDTEAKQSLRSIRGFARLRQHCTSRRSRALSRDVRFGIAGFHAICAYATDGRQIGRDGHGPENRQTVAARIVPHTLGKGGRVRCDLNGKRTLKERIRAEGRGFDGKILRYLVSNDQRRGRTRVRSHFGFGTDTRRTSAQVQLGLSRESDDGKTGNDENTLHDFSF
jgi:hypothetical protein